MKMMKKISSIVVALFMIFTLAVRVSAAEPTYTITINNDATGHTYEAYQIFAGDLYEGKLSNITWGSGVSEAGKTADAATKVESLKTTADAKTFAQEIAEYLAAHTDSQKQQGQYTISGLAPGYYLVKDKDASITGDDTYTGYILEVVGNVTVEPKGDKPTVEKVDDVNDSTNKEDGENWQDSADYDIRDAVPFKLTGTLPTNYDDYYSYTYIFHDTLSAGLTYNGDAKVYVVNGDDEVEITESFKITYDEINHKLTVSCNNLKTNDLKQIILSTSNIVVEYTATLNTDAVIGSAGNPNTVYLEYSNNPNHNGEGDTGNTPEDKVIVFTFKTIINKVDENGEALEGAEFTLEKWNEKEQRWDNVTGSVSEGTIFTFTGLDDGFYRLTETKTPDGYNTIKPVYFIVTATHDITADNPTLTDLSVQIVDEDKEPIANPETGGFTIDLGEGSMSANIENKSGPELPSTGGIGTTIFYVVGGSLMVIAAVLFVAKKKAENK